MDNDRPHGLWERWILTIAMLLSAGCAGHSRTVRVFDPTTLSPLRNADFEEGRGGEEPLGWRFGARPSGAYATRTVAESCYWGKQCGIVESTTAGPLPADSVAFLHQIVDASGYRGKKFVFGAYVRANVSGPPNLARLLVRVHRDNGETSFFDNMGDRPITSKNWTRYEIAGRISSDARDIEVGMQIAGTGAA